MNINPINNIQTNFNGYLKFKTGRYVNTKNITTVLYDYPDLVANDKFHSSAFLMSDGLKYIIKYLSKPKATLIENIINADKDHKQLWRLMRKSQQWLIKPSCLKKCRIKI